MKPLYYSLEQFMGMIDEPNRSRCFKLFIDHRERFRSARGSSYIHQAWPGGYLDHIQEVMNLAVIFYRALSAARPLLFSLSDALLVLYLHDLEKPWKYEEVDGKFEVVPALREKEAQKQFRLGLIKEYKIVLSPEQANALNYVEGENKDYSNRQRAAGPLAAFCHVCDVTSARIWFDYPAKKDDPWKE